MSMSITTDTALAAADICYEDDEIVNSLNQLINKNEEKCREITKQYYEILETQAATLKDQMIEASIGTFPNRRISLISDCNHLMSSLEKLSQRSEPLRRDTESLEMVRIRLEESLDIVNMIIDIRFIDTELKSAIESEDYEKATKLVVEYRSIVAKGLNQGPERSIIESLKSSEKQLVKIVGRKFRDAVIKKNRQVVSDLAKLFYPLNLHKEGILCYINFLRESMSNKCASNFKVLSSTTGAVTSSLKSSFNAAIGVEQSRPPGTHAKLTEAVFETAEEFIQEHQNVRLFFATHVINTYCNYLCFIGLNCKTISALLLYKKTQI